MSFDLKSQTRCVHSLERFVTVIRFASTRRTGGYEFKPTRLRNLIRSIRQIAARLLSVLGRWRRFSDPNQALMHRALERIAQMDNLSRDCHEVVSKTLASQSTTQ